MQQTKLPETIYGARRIITGTVEYEHRRLLSPDASEGGLICTIVNSLLATLFGLATSIQPDKAFYKKYSKVR